ncbi:MULTISPECIES: CD1375 family protein [unclassified Paenibacillus]
MAKVYASLIRKDLKTLEQVPETKREEVAALLKE